MWQPSRMVVFGLVVLAVGTLLVGLAGWLGGRDSSESDGDDRESEAEGQAIFPIDSAIEYEIWRGFECLETFTGHVSEDCPEARPNLHTGVDILAEIGVPVMAVSGGTVIYAGPYTTALPDCTSNQTPRTGVAMPENDYGLQIIIEDGDYVYVYLHLSGFNTTVGTRYETGGAVIGYVGSRGCGTTPHLHFEVQYRGEAIDPLEFLANQSYD